MTAYAPPPNDAEPELFGVCAAWKAPLLEGDALLRHREAIVAMLPPSDVRGGRPIRGALTRLAEIVGVVPQRVWQVWSGYPLRPKTMRSWKAAVARANAGRRPKPVDRASKGRPKAGRVATKARNRPVMPEETAYARTRIAAWSDVPVDPVSDSLPYGVASYVAAYLGVTRPFIWRIWKGQARLPARFTTG